MALHSLHDLVTVATGAQVGGQDHHRVAEVDGAALAVGEATLVQHLEKHVEDVGVGLLYLVEKHERVRATTNSLSELAASVVADISRRGTDQARNRVLLTVFGHVDADHCGFVVEKELRKRLGQLRLTHTRRAEEEERADRTVRIRHARTGATHRVRHRDDGFFLADDTLTQHRFHVEQLLGLTLHHLAGRNARPGRDDIGDDVRRDFLLQHRLVAGLRLRLGYLRLQFGDAAVAQLGDLGVVAVTLRDLGLVAQALELLLRGLDLVHLSLLVFPTRLHLTEAFALISKFLAQVLEALLRRRVRLLLQRDLLDF